MYFLFKKMQKQYNITIYNKRYNYYYCEGGFLFGKSVEIIFFDFSKNITNDMCFVNYKTK